MTREGCAVSHRKCLVEIASSLLSCGHRYLLTPTHTDADANATCSYEGLMNMQILFIPCTWACVSGSMRGMKAVHDVETLSGVMALTDKVKPWR